MEMPRTTEPSAPDMGAPEHITSPEVPAAVDIYSVDGIDAWRDAQYARWRAYGRNGLFTTDTKRQLFASTLDDSIDAYLQANGVAADSEDYDALRELYRRSDILAVHNDNWYTSPASRGEPGDDWQSPRDKAIAALYDLRSSDDDTPPDDDPDTPEGDADTTEAEARAAAVVQMFKRELAANEFAGEDEFAEAGAEYLKIIARDQKGHVRGIDLKGKLAGFLDRIGASKVVDFLSKPSREEAGAAAAYKAQGELRDAHMAHIREQLVANGEITESESRWLRAELLSEEYASNTRGIAKLQKEHAGKPVNKWLRRIGYGVAGVAGGALAFTPLGWLAGGLTGLAVGGALAGAIRVGANKYNANTVHVNAAGEADGVMADVVASDNIEKANQALADDRAAGHEDNFTRETIISTHAYDKGREVEKNRNRLLRPLIGGVAVAAAVAATRLGIDQGWFNGWHIGEQPAPNEPGGSNGGQNTGNTVVGNADGGAAKDGASKGGAEAVPGLSPNTYVDNGSGVEREIIDTAKASNITVSPGRAHEIYAQLKQEFGSNLLTMQDGKGHSTYMTGTGEVRLDREGWATWPKPVLDRLNELVKIK